MLNRRLTGNAASEYFNECNSNEFACNVTIIDEIEVSAPFKSKKLFTVVIKYIAPVFIVLILVSSVLDVLGILKI